MQVPILAPDQEVVMDPVDVVIAQLVQEEDRRPRRDSIDIVRRKVVGADGIVAVEFESDSGDGYRGLYGVELSDGQWRAGGSASRRVGYGRPGAPLTETGGWSSGIRPESRAAFGGWVSDTDAAHIRLRDRQGRVLEDDIETGVVLLMWTGAFDGDGATAEVTDGAGNVLFGGPIATI